MKKTPKKPVIPDFTEFTDENGKKWVQTSTDDLFSMQELNDILESIDSEKESGEIVLARIDFQKVNKEYYDSVVTLQSKLHKQTELLKKIITESREKIDRKNRKLRELIDYIKKMHMYIAYIHSNQERLETLEIPPELMPVIAPAAAKAAEPEPAEESIFESVEEIFVDDDGEEKGPVK